MAGRADNGTAAYFDFNNTAAGFGSPTGTINYNGSFWSASSAGTTTATAPISTSQLTFGNADSDLAGTTFNIDLNDDIGFTGILINSTSADVTIIGGANTGSSFFGDSGPTICRLRHG